MAEEPCDCQPTTPRGPEETRLLDRLFDDPDRKLLHFNVMIDPNRLRPTREQLCADVNRCLDAYERGECPVIESIDRDNADARREVPMSQPDTAIWQPAREELLDIALNDLGRPIPSTKGMDPKARAQRLHAELEARISIARLALRPKGNING